ncbi:MAG TPA: type VII secretion-associated serine protease mycosin [Pilimelia sp.]|nr:type VII secretion-associated serine protease mycosin [Pilimelia sp.]
MWAALAAVAALGVAGVAPGLPGGVSGDGAVASGGTGPGGVSGGGAGLGAAVPAARPDTVRAEQWQLDALRMDAAWRLATGSGVTVAVLDSGVDAKHPDLVGQVLPGVDLVSGTGDGRTDPVGHGTTVAGFVAGRNDDDRGVVGLAPQAKILPVRVLDADNRYDDAVIVARGVRWAVDHGARVLNLSLGGVGESAALAEALDYAFAKDVVVVACTGNVTPSAPTEVWYPAREPGVVAVSGLDRGNPDILWSNSITGPATVVSAPANGLYGARPGGYWRVQGTSFAAPLVAATAALVRSRWPTMSAADVVNRLIRTARDIGPTGRDESYGFGAVNPVAALTAVIPTVATNPLDTAPPPGVAGFGPAPGVVDEPGTPATEAQAAGTNAAGGAAEPVAAREPKPGSGGLMTGVAIVIVLVAGGTVVVRRLDRPGF